jgi:hypothetical protein
LPRPEWTHEAHLAATTYLLLKRPDIDLDEELPDIIRRYNESVGGVNSDTKAITRRSLGSSCEESGCSRRGRPAPAIAPAGQRAAAVTDGEARLAAALLFAERLFSSEARRRFVAGDIAAIP